MNLIDTLHLRTEKNSTKFLEKLEILEKTLENRRQKALQRQNNLQNLHISSSKKLKFPALTDRSIQTNVSLLESNSEIKSRFVKQLVYRNLRQKNKLASLDMNHEKLNNRQDNEKSIQLFTTDQSICMKQPFEVNSQTSIRDYPSSCLAISDRGSSIIAKKTYTNFTKKGLNKYHTSLALLDKGSILQQDDSDEELFLPQLKMKKQVDVVNQGEVQKLSENQTEELTFYDRKAIIFQVNCKNKLFPLSVILISRLEEIETYVSRWDNKPNPSNFEQHFFTKEFKIIFSDEHEFNYVYMTLLSLKAAKIAIKISFAGQKKVELEKPDLPTSLKDFKKKRRKKSFGEEAKEFLDFYRKNYISKEAVENYEKRVAEVPKRDKIIQNIENQNKYPELHSNIITHRQEYLREAIKKAKEIRVTQEEKFTEKTILSIVRPDLNKEIEKLLTNQLAQHTKKTIFENNWLSFLICVIMMRRISKKFREKKTLFYFQESKRFAIYSIDTLLYNAYCRLKTEWPSNSINHHRANMTSVMLSSLAFIPSSTKSKKIMIGFLAESAKRICLHQCIFKFNDSVQNTIRCFKQTMKFLKINTIFLGKSWEKEIFYFLDLELKQTEPVKKGKKGKKKKEKSNEMIEIFGNVGKIPINIRNKIIKKIIQDIINNFVCARYRQLYKTNKSSLEQKKIKFDPNFYEKIASVFDIYSQLIKKAEKQLCGEAAPPKTDKKPGNIKKGPESKEFIDLNISPAIKINYFIIENKKCGLTITPEFWRALILQVLEALKVNMFTEDEEQINQKTS